MSETAEARTVSLDTVLSVCLVYYPPLAVVFAWFSIDTLLPVVGIATALSASIYLMNFYGNNTFADDFDVYSRFRISLPWLPLPALVTITLTSDLVILGETSVIYQSVSAIVILVAEYILIHEIKRRELL